VDEPSHCIFGIGMINSRIERGSALETIIREENAALDWLNHVNFIKLWLKKSSVML